MTLPHGTRPLSGVLRALSDYDPAWHIFAGSGQPPPVMPPDREAGPLHGWLIGLKDNIAMEGRVPGAGLARALATGDVPSNVARRLSDAGAQLIGGLAMDEGALGASGQNPWGGITRNPADPMASTGGSSSGSAAAVAAGLVHAAIGTDTMGSVRIPAAFCGILGLKPTRGLIGRGGIVALAPSLDTVGLLATTTGALRSLLAVLSGPDPSDPDSAIGSPVPGSAGMPRLGLAAAPMMPELAPQTRAARDAAVAGLGALGLPVRPITIADWTPALTRRAAFLTVEAEAAESLSWALEAGIASPALRRKLDHGRDLGAERRAMAHETLSRAAAGCNAALQAVDILITATTPAPAQDAGQSAPVEVADFTVLANAAGLPALSLPLPVPAGKRPVGLQLIGRPWAEAYLLWLADWMTAAGLTARPTSA